MNIVEKWWQARFISDAHSDKVGICFGLLVSVARYRVDRVTSKTAEPHAFPRILVDMRGAGGGRRLTFLAPRTRKTRNPSIPSHSQS